MKESTLEKLANQKHLVMIERKHIDANRLYGFLLGVSSELILLHHESDFQLDGYTVLRRRDVTRLVRRDLERFHERIQFEEGITPDVALPYSIDLSEWRSVLLSLQRIGCNISLENEPDLTYTYLVGKILKVNPRSVIMLGFDPFAKWHDQSTRIPYTDITRICFQNRYISVLSEYTQ